MRIDDELLGDAFARHAGGCAPVADVDDLLRRIDRRQRRALAGRLTLAAGGLALALFVALARANDAGGTVEIDTVTAPTVAPATTTTAAASTTAASTTSTTATTTTTTTTTTPSTTALPGAPPRSDEPAVAPTTPPSAAATSTAPATSPTTAAPTTTAPPTTTSTAPPATTTTTTKPSSAPFVAHNTYGSCDSDPPYDDYYGTADPGSAVEVTSEYGSKGTTADWDGTWWLRVEFPDAPVGVEFTVTVTSAQGTVEFPFVRTG